jgi:hypothetical protein
MKRVLAFLALACALLAVSACHYDISLSVDASARVTYEDLTYVDISPSTYTGFHRKSLTDDDLEWIFIDLTKKVKADFTTGMLHLDIYDEITGAPLRTEDYAVVYSNVTGRYEFAYLDSYFDGM